MAVKVIDASAAVAVVFFETQFEATTSRLNGHDLAAPNILSFEVTNACLIKLRRHPDGRELLLRNFERFFDLQIAIVRINERAVLEIAEQTDLTVYDASYLWLARQLDAELVTLDRKLAAVAARR